ncbi:hypothetical protein QYE76_022814 [Lolium multiflorum]|uniref:Tf2-1-like SH3-like domain-containing protein n=1 Tax=Lolium multiflorum TaxID=4521 RepID=A0AAD8VRP1_LOLMU|nr:hypothetical protein QYE76_022814 [Lolium multiflorum]
MKKLLKMHLEHVRLRMKHQADKGRTERHFEEGDWVYLKLQPYLQSSVERRANHKLSFKYFAPFQIEKKVGTVAYKLILPEHSLVHPVFHVSLLKKSLPREIMAEATLPPDASTEQVPERVLARRRRILGNTTLLEGKVVWSGVSDNLATWDNLQELKKRFPEAPAWGQAGSQGEGDVTNPATGLTRRHAVDEHLKFCPVPEAKELRQSRRERRHNHRVNGPEWTT